MDYSDLLNKSWDEIPEEQLLPDGAYRAKGRNVTFMKPKEEDKSPKIVFFYEPVEPVDVNEDALADLGADYDLSINNLGYTVYIEGPRDLDKVRKHLALHGIEVDPSKPILNEDNKLSFGKAFVGAEIIGRITQSSYQRNGETVWVNNIGSFQRVE